MSRNTYQAIRDNFSLDSGDWGSLASPIHRGSFIVWTNRTSGTYGTTAINIPNTIGMKGRPANSTGIACYEGSEYEHHNSHAYIG